MPKINFFQLLVPHPLSNPKKIIPKFFFFSLFSSQFPHISPSVNIRKIAVLLVFFLFAPQTKTKKQSIINMCCVVISVSPLTLFFFFSEKIFTPICSLIFNPQKANLLVENGAKSFLFFSFFRLFYFIPLLKMTE